MSNSGSFRRARWWRKALLAGTGLFAALGLGLPAVGANTSATPPWLDPSKPTVARVEALLNAMTLAEKVGQMDQQLVDNVTDPNSGRCNTGTFGMPNAAFNTSDRFK